MPINIKGFYIKQGNECMYLSMNKSASQHQVKQSMNEISNARTEDYLSNTSINSPVVRGNSSFTVLRSVQDGDDAAIVRSQEDIQSSRSVCSVPELQA